MIRIYNRKNKGFSLLASVIIVSSIATVIILTVSTLSARSIQISRVFENSNKAKGFANACVEIVLQDIRDSGTFSGSGNLSFEDGSCSYVISNLGISSREINATGVSGNVTRKVEVFIDSINPQINISSWKEVADF